MNADAGMHTDLILADSTLGCEYSFRFGKSKIGKYCVNKNLSPPPPAMAAVSGKQSVWLLYHDLSKSFKPNCPSTKWSW